MLILTQDRRLIVNTAHVFEIGVIKSADPEGYRVAATIHTGHLDSVQFENLGTYRTEEEAEAVLANIVTDAKSGVGGYVMEK